MVKRDFGQEPLTQDEIINCYWYVVIDDTIGGWSISNVNETVSHLNPYEGRFELGSFLTEYEAQHIVELHNHWYGNKVYETYTPNIEYIIDKQLDKLREADLTEDDWFDYDTPYETT